MRKKLIWLILLFVLSLALGLLINTPARQILRFVSLPDTLVMQGLQGTLRAGRIQQLGYQGLLFSDLGYRLQPGCLFKLALCYRIETAADDLDLQLQTSLLRGSVSVLDSRVRFGEEVFSAVPGLLIRPRGDFIIDIEQLSIRQQKLHDLIGRISWNRAGLEGEEQELGNYSALISQVSEGFNLKLDQSTGLLVARGDMQLEWSGNYRVNMTLEGKAGLNDSVNNALGLLASKTGLNQYRIDRKGRIDRNLLQRMKSLQPSSAD